MHVEYFALKATTKTVSRVNESLSLQEMSGPCIPGLSSDRASSTVSASESSLCCGIWVLFGGLGLHNYHFPY
jgi:hypothetical protein